jgi:hypothetical protein
MFGIETLSGSSYAMAIVGIVLVEAMVLYVGYGTLTRLAGPGIIARVRGE